MFSHKITPDLELRQLQLADAKALIEIVNAHRAYLREWLHWVDGTLTVRDAERFIVTALHEYNESQAFTAGIWLSGQLVGAIGHNRIDWPHQMGNPGWWLIPAAQGKGVMTQCCRVVFNHAFNQLRLSRLCVGVATGNARGHEMVKRLGFVRISTLRNAEKLQGKNVDHVIYELTASPTIASLAAASARLLP
jgi:ribosomal-protein-serine acetyltransferase